MTQSGQHSIVLASGGLDSTALIHLANEENANQLTLLSFYYGQKWAAAEEHALWEVTKWYRRERPKTNTYKWIRIELPALEHLPDSPIIAGRNAIMMSVAVAQAIMHGALRVYIGAHATDAPAFPDCTTHFMQHMANAFWTGYGISLRYPYLEQGWFKSEIVKFMAVNGLPMHLTYSCYEGQERHCGICPTCIERKKAFRDAEVTDPTEYIS